MKKIAIFFFSGTGNTRYVTDRIKESLSKDAEVSVFAIELHRKDASDIIKGYDLIGLAYPIYGSSLPPIVKEFINDLEPTDKQAFTFCTQMVFSGDGAAFGGRLLRKRGFKVLWQEHFNMPINATDIRFLVSRKPIDYGKIQKRTDKKAVVFAHRILSGKPYRLGSNPISLILGLLQRVPYELFEKRFVQNALKIDHEKCTLCGKCVLLCPTKTLSIEDGLVKKGDDCTLCYRCINHCPELAIYALTKKGVKAAYLGPEPNYRINRVMRDDPNEKNPS